MSKIPHFGLRGLQFLLTLLILALAGNMVAIAIGGSPSIINYCVFVAVLSMLTLIYQFVALSSEGLMLHPMLPALLDGLNVLFFLIGGIALAAELPPQSCGNSSFTSTNNVTSGSYNPTQRCHEGQAVCAFLWFGFAAYAAALALDLMGGSGSTANLRGGMGGIRRGGGPSMSQV